MKNNQVFAKLSHLCSIKYLAIFLPNLPTHNSLSINAFMIVFYTDPNYVKIFLFIFDLAQ